MKESYGEGAATRTGPESCAAVRKDGGEALTGGSVGRVLSREIHGPWRKPRPVAAARPHLSPVSPCALRRRYPRQEPDAVMPHVRICGGGHGRPWSLLRLCRP